MSAMQTAIKNNTRKNRNNKPFKGFVPKYLKGKPLFSKRLSIQEKRELLIKLEENQKTNSIFYKLIISLGLTTIIIGGIVFIIKFTFF